MQINRSFRQLALAALAALFVGGGGQAWAQAQSQAGHKAKWPDYPLTLAEQGNFFVNGHYVHLASDTTGGHIMWRQMYVTYKIPAHVTRPYPIVIIHGGGLTGNGYEATPDGREGWMDYFVARGFKVYNVDQPARGRSVYHNELYGPQAPAGTAEGLEMRFTAIEDFNLWPQAHLHTQWPDAGHIGDPFFDQFFASEVRGIDATVNSEVIRQAGAALLDSIGPAIILTHSQSGAYGWLIADARPNLTKGVLAVEPSGPPFYSVVDVGPPNWFEDGTLDRPWGITLTPVTYAPAVSDPSQLHYALQSQPDRPDFVRCRLQTAPVHRLPNLAKVPIVIITSEAGYHASYDHCTSKYLRQAGVANTWVPLESRGIHGNGHMMMLEKNNLRIAQLIVKLIENHMNSAARSVAAR